MAQSKSKSKSDALFERVRSDILSLDLPPDTPMRLPAMSERYGIGLTPLRECLNRLAGDQLVVPEHNKGFRVAPLTHADLLDLERSRNAIEGEMFVHSVLHGDDKWEAGVIGAYHHLSRTPVPQAFVDDDALTLWTRRHGAFHGALVAGSNSIWMHRFAYQLRDLLGRYHRFIQSGLRDLTTTAPSVASRATEAFSAAMALQHHEDLYEAALARDGATARSAFDAHTGLTIAAFEELADLMPEGSPLTGTLTPLSETSL